MKIAIVKASELSNSLLASDYVEWPEIPPEVAKEIDHLKKQRKYALARARKLRIQEQRLRAEYSRGYTMVEVLLGIAILCICGVVVYAYVSDDASKEPTVAAAGDVLPGRIHIVCIEKHEYAYMQSRWEGFSRAGMAPLFDEEGKPRKCRTEKRR